MSNEKFFEVSNFEFLSRQPDARGSSRNAGASRPESYISDPDQWYLDAIEKYKTNPQLYEYLLKNPHLIRNSGSYSPYWYEQLIGTTDTNAQRYENQLRSDATNWMANAISEFHVEDYTSEVSQADRAKQAGVNIDLNGGQALSPGDPANPQSTDTDSNLPYAMTNQANSDVQGVISSVMNIVSMGMSFAQQFQTLNAGEIQLLNGEIENYSGFNKLIGDMISQNLSPEELQAIVSGKDNGEILGKVLNYIYSDRFQSQLPPRIRKKINRFSRRGVFTDVNSRNQFIDILKTYVSDRYDLASSMGHPFYKDDFSDMMKTIGEYLSKYQIEYDQLWKDFDFDKLNVIDKESGLSLGEMEGQAQLASKKYEALRAQSDKMTENLWNSIISALSSKNTWWSNILLFFVPFARSMAENARMPSMGLSASVRNGVHDTKDVYMH